MNRKMLSGLIKLSVVVSLLIPSQIFAKDLILMTAPPRESAEAGQKLYGPIAAHLSKTLGTKVIYQYPENWIT